MKMNKSMKMNEDIKLPLDAKYNQDVVISLNGNSNATFWYKLNRFGKVPAGSWYYNTILNNVSQARNDYSMLEHCILVSESNNPKLQQLPKEEKEFELTIRMKICHFIGTL